MGWLLVFGLVVVGAHLMQNARQQTGETTREYSDFLDQLRQGKVQSVTVVEPGRLLLVQFRGNERRVRVPGPGSLEVLDRHLAREQPSGMPVKVEYVTPSPWADALRHLVLATPLLVLLVLLYANLLRQVGAGNAQAMSFNRSRARRLSDAMPRKTFDDVAGVDEAKEELVEIVDFLRQGEKYQRLGAQIPKGVLLMGPPGCGKTLLARAVAGEAEVPFFHISGSDFVEMFVGVGASRVRDLFEQAKVNRPCIVFIDELDAVGRQRGAGLGGGHDEREQTVNQLLVEMDGFEPNAGIIVMAATNRPDILDPALLRPGRFDRRVVVDSPDFGGRRDILALYIKAKPVAPDVDIDVLARQTAGLTGADLYSIINEASILAAGRDEPLISMAHCEEAIERVVAGRERRSRVLTPTERASVANHEAGHALVSYFLPSCPMVHKVTILPRGMALGYVLTLPNEERFNHTRAELLARLAQGLGGRAAEELVYGPDGITTGAENDLERVTDLARAMVCDYGMSPAIGPRALGRHHGPIFLGRDLAEERNYSEQIAHTVDEEIRRLVDDAYAQATSIISERRAELEKLVAVLLERETLHGGDLEAMLGPPPAKVGLAAEELVALETRPAGAQ
jgi:cell division protease FtsH